MSNEQLAVFLQSIVDSLNDELNIACESLEPKVGQKVKSPFSNHDWLHVKELDGLKAEIDRIESHIDHLRGGR